MSRIRLLRKTANPPRFPTIIVITKHKKFIAKFSQLGSSALKNIYDFAKLRPSILTLVTKLHKIEVTYPHKWVNG